MSPGPFLPLTFPAAVGEPPRCPDGGACPDEGLQCPNLGGGCSLGWCESRLGIVNPGDERVPSLRGPGEKQPAWSASPRPHPSWAQEKAAQVSGRLCLLSGVPRGDGRVQMPFLTHNQGTDPAS